MAGENSRSEPGGGLATVTGSDPEGNGGPAAVEPKRPNPLLWLLRGATKRGAAARVSPPFLLMVGFIAFLVLGPIVIMLMVSLQEGTFGNITGYGFQAWIDVANSARIRNTLSTTLLISLTRQSIAIVVGVWLSWLIARTDLPFAKTLEYGFWIAVFLPGLTVTLSWIMVFDPFYGIANRAITALPFISSSPFNIYSWWGIIWVHLVSGTLPVKVMLLTPAFRNLDGALEEAARSTGASSFQTLRHIVVPLVTPAIVIALVIGTIRSLEAFEIELILGAPQRIDVLSTEIYRMTRRATPQYSQATVVGMITLLIMLPAVIFQRRYTAKRSHATVTGKSTVNLRPLGRLRWPLFAVVASIVGIMTVFPMAVVIMGTFMSLFGRFDATPTWTMRHWETVLANPTFLRALWNTVVLSFGTAIVSMILFALIAYLIVRTTLRGRAFLDYMVWLPTMLPGVVISLGYLILFIRVPFLNPMYGTMSILIIVAALGSMTLTVQMMKTSIVQIGAELEEASRSAGGNWFSTFRTVLLPLIAPALVVVGVLAFSAAAKTTGHVALLSTSRNQPLSILQLNQMADFNLEVSSVIGVFILLGTVGVALVARALGYKARG